MAVAVLLAGCASAPSVPDEKTVKLNALLDEVSRFEEEGVRRCLPTVLYRNVDIIDEKRLIFRGRGDKAWLNELRHECHGLRRNDTLMFELHNSRACEMDTVSVVDRTLAWNLSGPTCRLGDFKPIPPGYLERIDELLRD